MSQEVGRLRKLGHSESLVVSGSGCLRKLVLEKFGCLGQLGYPEKFGCLRKLVLGKLGDHRKLVVSLSRTARSSDKAWSSQEVSHCRKLGRLKKLVIRKFGRLRKLGHPGKFGC